jgi:hypothetical protein
MARLQFLVNDEMLSEIDTLVETTGLKTRTQLLNTAVTLFEWAVREKRNGRIIASMDEETGRYKEIELSGIPATAPSTVAEGEYVIPQDVMAEVEKNRTEIEALRAKLDAMLNTSMELRPIRFS